MFSDERTLRQFVIHKHALKGCKGAYSMEKILQKREIWNLRDELRATKTATICVSVIDYILPFTIFKICMTIESKNYYIDLFSNYVYIIHMTTTT